MEYYIVIIWLFLGICGYLMLRQGSLVSFESALGKRESWGYMDIALGIPYILVGPIFIIQALALEGRNCFHRRNYL